MDFNLDQEEKSHPLFFNVEIHIGYRGPYFDSNDLLTQIDKMIESRPSSSNHTDLIRLAIGLGLAHCVHSQITPTLWNLNGSFMGVLKLPDYPVNPTVHTVVGQEITDGCGLLYPDISVYSKIYIMLGNESKVQDIITHWYTGEGGVCYEYDFSLPTVAGALKFEHLFL
ncbi:hypothetical protein [La Joya virus]|uniref:Uncharacterized protein n=1 Tax=La Joya virus TaxID=1272946 RepID=A0A0D3R1C3_9RHAB|nr:hypothetical protein [La Joya virus]AJR28302.1 hypothetical protein [La Joya virus]